MKNSVIYLTRKCPRNCRYCSIRDGKGIGKQLDVEQWKRAFNILQEIGVDFNLILGNEPWLLGRGLLEIVNYTGVPYAVYTSCNLNLFNNHKDDFFKNGLNNFSAGLDYPPYTKYMDLSNVSKDELEKSYDAWATFIYLSKNHPEVEKHATVTVSKNNFRFLPKIISNLDKLGVYSNINFVHWDKDNSFDFFPGKDEMQSYIIKPEEYDELRNVLDEVKQNGILVQNRQMLDMDVNRLVEMEWHCKGDPYGGPTIDADGSLRVCGYRKGERTSKFNIFDLPKYGEQWEQAVYEDAMDCPGCSWSCPWMYQYWNNLDPNTGTEVFTKHKII
jgi:MoaA/NifB/PqqE/SkfB family radical SAM enzyme